MRLPTSLPGHTHAAAFVHVSHLMGGVHQRGGRRAAHRAAHRGAVGPERSGRSILKLTSLCRCAGPREAAFCILRAMRHLIVGVTGLADAFLSTVYVVWVCVFCLKMRCIGKKFLPGLRPGPRGRTGPLAWYGVCWGGGHSGVVRCPWTRRRGGRGCGGGGGAAAVVATAISRAKAPVLHCPRCCLCCLCCLCSKLARHWFIPKEAHKRGAANTARLTAAT